MDEDKEKYYSKFLVLRNLGIRINTLGDLEGIVQEALDRCVEILGLESGSISVWDDKTTRVTYEVMTGSPEKNQILQRIERDHLRVLRKDFSVEFAYLTLKSKDGAQTVFSYPIQSENRLVGAINGLFLGERNLPLEEEFLEALAHQLGLAVAKRNELLGREEEKKTEEKQKEAIKSERLSAIHQTSVAVNHEINNPLTAVLGNAQLLLTMKEGLDEETKEKLRIIEENALKIMNVTQTLLKIMEPVIVEYAGGVKMLDIHKSKKKEE